MGQIKIIYFLLFGLFISALHLHSQCYTLTYKDATKFPDFAIKDLAPKSGILPYSQYILHTDGKISVYSFLENKGEGTYTNIFNMYYFKNNIQDKIYQVDLSYPDTLGTIYSRIPATEWKISTDTSIIRGLSCIRAQLNKDGNNVVAYFASEIPINDGPRYFNNLPGLIIKVETASEIIELTDVKTVDDCAILQPSNYKIKYVEKKVWDKFIRSGVDSYIRN